MRWKIPSGVFVIWLTFAPISQVVTPQSAYGEAVAESACPVTVHDATRGPYGNDGLSVGISSDGITTFRPHGPGFVLADGSLSMKFLWGKGTGVRGALQIQGKRLDDASALPLHADIPAGYEDTDYQPSALIFPTAGCWQVTGEVGAITLTFVTRVIHIQGANGQGS